MSQSPSSRWYDERLRAARGALVARDAGPALALVGEVRVHPDWRAHYVSFLSRPGEAVLPALRDEMSRDPDNPDVCLLIGTALSVAAGDARGSDLYVNTSQEQRRGLRYFSGQARQALHRAAKLLPSDPVPWCELMNCAMATTDYPGEVADMWAEVLNRGGAYLYRANTIRLLTLTRKWGGSEKECFDFARGRTRDLPPGHPMLALIPLAHIEALSERLMTGNTATRIWHVLRYLKNGAVRAEVDAASHRLLAGSDHFAHHPSSAAAHQAFACVYHRAEANERARPHLERGGEQSADWPWVYFGDGDEQFTRARAAAGLPTPTP